MGSSTNTNESLRDRIGVSDPHGQLDRTLWTYAEHYNRGRPHRALGLASPLAAAGEPIPANPRDVRRRDLLDGLVHEYYGLAA